MSILKTTLRWFTDGAQHVLLYGMDHLGVPRQVRIDSIMNTLIAIDTGHNKVHAGDSYRYNDATTIASGASQDYLLTVPNTTKWPHFTFTADGTAVTTIEVFRATDKTGTTLQTTFNANENSANTAGMTIHKGTSGGTTDGVSIFKYASGSAGAGGRVDGASVYSGERMLKQNTKYILRITSGTAGNLCNLRAEWYEHTNLTS